MKFEPTRRRQTIHSSITTRRPRSGLIHQILLLWIPFLGVAYGIVVYWTMPRTMNAATVKPSSSSLPSTSKDVIQKQEGNTKTKTTTTIGFAVTITGCGSDPITEGAAVLMHSIHLASVHGNLGGRYDYQMYAMYHPDGESCAKSLADLGYTLVRRETPVAIQDIEGEVLRTKIANNGCCGEKELVKLEGKVLSPLPFLKIMKESDVCASLMVSLLVLVFSLSLSLSLLAYTLIQHPVVVHLDLDVLILKPLDALFDWMIETPPSDYEPHYPPNIPVMWPEQEPPQGPVNAFFTRDCKSSEVIYSFSSSAPEGGGERTGLLAEYPCILTQSSFPLFLNQTIW